MFNNEITLYTLDDVTVIPARTSRINHRAECNAHYDIDGRPMLPIFTAPMASVICAENVDIWSANGIIPIVPRTVHMKKRMEFMQQGIWIAVGLDEFRDMFSETGLKAFENGQTYRILIDIANGHSEYLCERIKHAKACAKGFELEIMAGNVANPKTYAELAWSGADYVRCSVGSGSVCITASNTACHYPMASLIDECYKLKNYHCFSCKIIADGGIRNFAHAIKALALGADYVMMGGTLAKCFESASEIFVDEFTGQTFNSECVFHKGALLNLNILNASRFCPKSEDMPDILSETEKRNVISHNELKKRHYGMSTRQAQAEIASARDNGGQQKLKLKTAEGITKTINVEYTVSQWTENFTDYLRSAMSYCDSRSLEEFIGTPQVVLMSQSAQNAINK